MEGEGRRGGGGRLTLTTTEEDFWGEVVWGANNIWANLALEGNGQKEKEGKTKRKMENLRITNFV